MKIYDSISYREILKILVEQQKKLHAYITFQKIAEECGIQKTYLSKVINETADLNQDQLYTVCDFLKLEDKEKEYMSLLLEYERSQNKKRKQILLDQIKKIQQAQQKTEATIFKNADLINDQFDEYYSNPMHLVVHYALLIDRYKQNFELLKKDLKISTSFFEKTIVLLKKLNIIDIIDNECLVKIDFLHTPKKASSLDPYHYLSRINAAQRILDAENAKAYNLSLCITTDETTRKWIQNQFLEFVKQMQEQVVATANENVYQLNFDLFQWNNPPEN